MQHLKTTLLNFGVIKNMQHAQYTNIIKINHPTKSLAPPKRTVDGNPPNALGCVKPAVLLEINYCTINSITGKFG